MYELTFSIENCNESLLKYLYDELSYSVGKVGGVCKYLQEKRRSKFALACNDLYATSIKHQSEEHLVDVLILGFKNLYVRKNLQIGEGNFFLNTLVNTMCLFDNKFDKQHIKNRLNVQGEVCIDGYYNFRMQRLKGKWNELVEIVKNNSALLNDKLLIKDFLTYLIDFFPPSLNTLSVVVDGNTFRLFDDNGKLLPSIKLVYQSQLEEVLAINAICLKPQKIKLYCNSRLLKKEFLDLLTHLFDVKVVENS